MFLLKLIIKYHRFENKYTDMKITKREIIFFIAGILTIFVIETIYDWNGFKDAVKRGYNDGYKEGIK